MYFESRNYSQSNKKLMGILSFSVQTQQSLTFFQELLHHLLWCTSWYGYSNNFLNVFETTNNVLGHFGSTVLQQLRYHSFPLSFIIESMHYVYNGKYIFLYLPKLIFHSQYHTYQLLKKYPWVLHYSWQISGLIQHIIKNHGQ